MLAKNIDNALTIWSRHKNTDVLSTYSRYPLFCTMLAELVPQFSFVDWLVAAMVATSRTQEKDKTPRSARPSRRKKDKKKSGVVVDKHAKAVALNMVASRIETVKANKGGGIELPYGTIAKVIEELLPTFPWLSRNMVKYHLKCLTSKKQRQQEPMGAIRRREETLLWTLGIRNQHC